MRLVLDTNVIVSALLRSASLPRQVVEVARRDHTILISGPTLNETIGVLRRPKLAPYINIAERDAFLQIFSDESEFVIITDDIDACRDPGDNKFLELAVSGKADYIITGDADLLTLHPYRDVRIVKAADFLEFAG